MKRTLRAVIAASAALAALPAAASADTVDGTVVARDAARGTVVTAARSGAATTLRVRRVAAFAPGERVRGRARPVGDGTFEAVRVKRRGRAGSVKLNATVVARTGRDYVVSAGGSTFALRAGRRARAAGPGALVAARLKVVKGKVTAKKVRQTGLATTLELEGTFVDAAEGSLRVKVAGALVTVLVPAGVGIWDEPGDEVALTVTVGPDGAFTLVADPEEPLEEDEELEDDEEWEDDGAWEDDGEWEDDEDWDEEDPGLDE
jgi:hypothetical protein